MDPFSYLRLPVGALLTHPEWLDELSNAGLLQVTGHAILGDSSIGVLVQSLAPGSRPLPQETTDPAYRWVGAETKTSAALRTTLWAQLAAPVEGAAPPAAQPIVFVLDADVPADQLGEVLTRLATLCADPTTVGTCLRVVITFGDLAADESPMSSPVWCAVTAAMKVAQNEYPALETQCLGIADMRPETLQLAVEVLLMPTAEREIYLAQGKRFVFRIVHGVPTPGKKNDADDTETAVHLVSRAASGRGALSWVSAGRIPVGPGEVEIEVAAAGLNFRDVMWNLGLLPEEALENGYAGARLGMECAGTVSSIGPEVDGLTVGDQVVAFVSGGFASHVIAPSFAVSPIPANMTFEAAATLPVAFLTAYYSLIHLAKLQPGETVLVHGGAGAVGLAAMQIARHCGARLIATAGSEEKRALLRDLGADVVLNSRTLAFADEVLAHTQGKGVDVVLNSLAGEAMVRSMDCLRPFGRFVELGKRDFYANTHVGLRPFRRNLAYFGVDVDQLLGDHRVLTQRLFSELMALFADGTFQPLPHRVLDGERISEAFRLMQRAGHIGKIVVRPPATSQVNTRAISGRFPVDANGLHLIVGGTSGFGLATAAWLAERGARHLVLASRSGVLSDEATAQTKALQDAGVDVRVATLDVTDDNAVQNLLRSLNARRPVKGIVHAAMVLDDRLIESIDRESIDKVLHPKVTGALNLTQAAAGLPLDYLLLYSSATTLIGNPGQFNYVAANGFLEGLASQASRRGLPAVAVAWGGIEDAGYLSRNMSSNASLRKRFASSVVAAHAALDGLDLIFDAEGRIGLSALAIARIDWAAAKRDLVVVRGPSFVSVAPTMGARLSADAAATLEKLKTMTLDEASDALLEVVVEEIARVLRLPSKEVDRHRALAEIGMDSLMMLELRSTVEDTLHVDLPIMSLANGITPADVARRVAILIVGDTSNGLENGGLLTLDGQVVGKLAAMSGSHLGGDVEAMDTAAREASVRAVLERSRRFDGPL